MLWTWDEEFADFLQRDEDYLLTVVAEKFPGVIEAVRGAIGALESGGLICVALLHKGCGVQARTSEKFGYHASNWIPVEPLS